MKHFIELDTKNYLRGEYKDFIDSQRTEDLLEGDEWKKSTVEEDDKELPRPFSARIRIKPESIIAYVESYSIEETRNNPDHPVYDCIDICMEHGLTVTVVSNIDEFEEKLDAYYAQFEKEDDNIALNK